jgi:polar amino acid transport system substrate-binding protein
MLQLWTDRLRGVLLIGLTSRLWSMGLVAGWSVLSGLPAAAADLETIQKRGYLIVAVKDNLRPLGFRNAAGGLEGWEIEIAQALAQAILGKPDAVRFKVVSNADRFTVLYNGQADLTLAHVTATIARARIVNFSQPYYLEGTSLVTKQPQIQRPDQCDTIAVLQGSSTIAALQYHFPKARLIPVASYAEAQQRLERGEAVAFAADTSTALGWIHEFPEYRRLNEQFERLPLAVALPKGLQYAELGQQVNQTLDRLQSAGWLEQRATAWGLPWDLGGRSPAPVQMPSRNSSPAPSRNSSPAPSRNSSPAPSRNSSRNIGPAQPVLAPLNSGLPSP